VTSVKGPDAIAKCIKVCARFSVQIEAQQYVFFHNSQTLLTNVLKPSLIESLKLLKLGTY